MVTVTSEMTTEPFDPALDAEIKKAVTALNDFVSHVTPAFDNPDDSGSITINSETPQTIPDVSISFADLKSLWSKITFVVTDKTYPPGFGGEFHFASTTSHIRHDTVNGWNLLSGGLPLITLHELLHSTNEGAEVWTKQWDDYRADCAAHGESDDQGANYSKSPFFSEVEEFCYCGSRALMSALGLAPYQGPKFDHGYDYGNLKEQDGGG